MLDKRSIVFLQTKDRNGDAGYILEELMEMVKRG